MPLTYDLTAVPVETRSDSDGNLSGVSQTLIFSTMMAGIGEISEKTAEEFYARIDLYQRLHGALMQGPDGPVPVTREHVFAHIGLKTNASFTVENRAKWLKRITQDVFNAADRAKR